MVSYPKEERLLTFRDGILYVLKRIVHESAAKKFASIAARGNYLALDRPDMAFAAKESMRKLSSPPRATGSS